MAETVAIGCGAARAVIDVERGGRLASLAIDGRELLVQPPNAVDRSIRWGLFLMAPWPGRLAGGRLAWDGRTIELRRHHGRNAIHGVVFDRPWQVHRRTVDTCELSIAFDPRGWPFHGRVRQRLALRLDRLELEAEIEADEPMPGAIGWHPWFRRNLASDSDGVRVRLVADGVLERRSMLPTGRILPVSGVADLRAGPVLGQRRLDDAFVGLREAPEIEWPELRLTLEIGPRLSVVTVYTPPEAFCIEPQTAWPNALGLVADAASRAGAVVVEPGRPLLARWSMRWS